MKKQYILFLLFTLYFSQLSLAQKRKDQNSYQSDTLKLAKAVDIIGVPIVFYTPESSFGFGGGAQLIFKRSINKFNARPSTLLTTFIYTFNKQITVDITPKFYLKKGLYYFDGAFKYRIKPYTFWGIGNNTPDSNEEEYNMITFSGKGAFLIRLPDSELNFGFQYQYENHQIIETIEGGQLDTGSFYGIEKTITSGIGIVFNHDTRDNIESSRSGSFVQINGLFSSKVLGATYSFNKYVVDIRRFISPSPKLTIALNAYIENTFGEVPWQSMGWMGGGNRQRGYFNGRYIDKNYYALQAEARFHIKKRFHLAAFVGMGEVAPNIKEFFKEIKPSYGAGFRYKLLKSQPLLIRIDMGFGDNGNSGFYLGVNEAF